MSVYNLDKLISKTRRLAADYRRATDKSLAVSSEIARHDACTQLKLEPVSQDESARFDAIGKQPPWNGLRIQINGRAIFDEGKSDQRIGKLKLDKELDAVALVLMVQNFNPSEIYLAARHDIMDTMEDNSSKLRNRATMSFARFKHVSHCVCTANEGLLPNHTFVTNQ